MKVNKSEQIRQLFDQGLTVQQISDHLGIRYQFAYNVISHYIKQKEWDSMRQHAATTEKSQPKKPYRDTWINRLFRK